jgi:hypothetical protein
MRATFRWNIIVFTLLLVSPAKGELRISLDDVTLYPGDLGSIDVFVSSDTGTDVLDAFSFEFEISGSGLEFMTPQTDSQLIDPNYIFYANSQALRFPPASTVLGSNTTVVTFDAANSDSIIGVTVPMAERLLVRLDLISLGPTGPFDINLIGTFNSLTDDNTFVTENLLSQQELTAPAVAVASSDLVGTATVVLPDFDIDGDVDGNDLLLWQRGDSPDQLSYSDLAVWEAYYGTNTNFLAASSSAVPEPVSGIMLLCAMIALLMCRDVAVS